MITTEITIWCDTCDQWHDGIGRNKREAKKNAKESGWRRVKIDRKMKDLCPDCAAKREARK